MERAVFGVITIFLHYIWRILNLIIMRKLFLLAAVAVMTLGCGVLRTPSDVAKRSYIGMSVAEFKKLTGGVFTIETMTTEYTVYRTNEWSGPPEHRYISGAKFFHFDANGRLVRIDSRDFTPPFFRDRHHSEPLNP